MKEKNIRKNKKITAREIIFLLAVFLLLNFI